MTKLKIRKVSYPGKLAYGNKSIAGDPSLDDLLSRLAVVTDDTQYNISGESVFGNGSLNDAKYSAYSFATDSLRMIPFTMNLSIAVNGGYSPKRFR